MPITGQKRKDYDRKYYEKRKHTKTSMRKIFYPLRLEESIVAQALQMASEAQLQGKYPTTWKTATGVLRGLIVRGLQAMKDDGDQQVSEGLAAIELQQHLGGINRHRREAISAMTQARTEIAALLDIKAETEALQYYASTVDAAHKMSRSVWTDWLTTEMAKAFPALHKMYRRGQVPGTKLRGSKGRGRR